MLSIDNLHAGSSKDGTKIPLMITYRKGLELTGDTPTILYGYGGFNISLTPSFSITNAVWLMQGGIYVVPNLRGGGEYGKEWHDAGTQMKKQNVFDDFIAADTIFMALVIWSSLDKLLPGGLSNVSQIDFTGARKKTKHSKPHHL